MNVTRYALVAVLAVGAGCSTNKPSEDATYEGSDVAHEPINQVFPPFAFQTVAIVPFVNKSLSRYRELGNSAPDILAAMAIDAGFRVVEGKGGQLDAVMEEVNFGQSEFVDPKSAAKIGKMLGAKYVLLGSVTDYNEVRTSGKKQFDFLGLAEVGSGGKSMVQNMAVSSRLVDVETREVLGADSMTRKKQKYEVEGGKFKILGIGTESRQTVETENETLGALIRLCFATSLNKVTGQLNRRAGMMQQQPGGAAPAPPAPAGGSGPAPGE